LRAFAQFKKMRPNALMYLHTLKSTAKGGVDFAELLRRLGLVEGKDVIFSDQYTYTIGWPEERMATLYQAFDVLSLTSSGEGFGIPIIEAQACGIPVVTANNSAMPELTFAGTIVTDQHPYFTPLGAWSYLPDVGAIEDAYHEMYAKIRLVGQRQKLAERAREGALTFDWDRVIDEHWRPLLEEIQAERMEIESGSAVADPQRVNGHERVGDGALQPA
jgi:glycosyltransferase involved in cell wall biosynthesis